MRLSGYLRSARGRARRPIPQRTDRAQALVEFSLILPLLLVIVFGIIEFANGWRTYQVITNVAREGARVAVTPKGTPDVVLAKIEELLIAGSLDPAQATITLNLCSTTGCTGSPDEVIIDYPHKFVLVGPLINLACGGGCGGPDGTIILSTTSIMRNE